MARQLRYGVALAALAACVVVAGAQAAGIDVTSMTLQATDLPGATQASAGTVKEAGYTSSYARTFQFTAPNGAAQLLFVSSEASLAPTVAKTTSDEATLRRVYSSKAGKALFANAVAKLVKVKARAVVVGQPQTVAAGDAAFGVPVSVTVKGHRLYVSLMYMQLDRVLVLQVVDGLRPATGMGTKLLGLTAAHIGTALTPQSATAPTVTGTPQAGQTLTASPGTWTVTPTSTAYQWQRCDQTGANCVDIEGATTSTYAVQQSDGGFTLRVNVTATNRFGSATAPSATVLVVV